MSVPPFLALPDGARRRDLPTGRGPLAAIEVGPAGAGAGSALLVPGFTGSKEDFVAVLGPLARRGWRVTALDLRGQYDSPGPDDEAAYTLDLLAADLAEVIDRIATESGGPIHLVGHSMGGLVVRAAVLGMADPAATVASMTLLCSGPAALPPDRRGPIPVLHEVLPGTPLEAVWQAKLAMDLANGFEPPPAPLQEFLHERWLATNAWGLRGMAGILLSEGDRTAELAATGIPVLVCHGQGDDVWPLAEQADMARHLGAPPVVIPECAHSPAAEAPEATAAVFDAFWRSRHPARGLVAAMGYESAPAGVIPLPGGYAPAMQVAAPLDPTPAAAGTARRLVDRTLADWGLQDLMPDAVLVASELVSNAVRHGCPPLRLQVSRRAATLRIAVRDGLPERVPLRRDVPADGCAGRGLLIVGEVSRAWGWDRETDGKLVWADLPCPDDTPRA